MDVSRQMEAAEFTAADGAVAEGIQFRGWDAADYAAHAGRLPLHSRRLPSGGSNSAGVTRKAARPAECLRFPATAANASNGLRLSRGATFMPRKTTQRPPVVSTKSEASPAADDHREYHRYA